jgi:hypothetical protein
MSHGGTVPGSPGRVLIPGEPEVREEKERRRTGIPYSASEGAVLQAEDLKPGRKLLVFLNNRSFESAQLGSSAPYQIANNFDTGHENPGSTSSPSSN